MATCKHLQLHGRAYGEESCCWKHSRPGLGCISGLKDCCLKRTGVVVGSRAMGVGVWIHGRWKSRLSLYVKRVPL